MIRRTATITAATIAGVVLAGGAAIGTNIGILSAADESPLGELSAVAPTLVSSTEPTPDATPSPVETAAATPATPAGPPASTPAASTSFVVDDAGQVDVSSEGGIVEITGVELNPGWSWELAGGGETNLQLRFTNGDDVLEFTAERLADGTVAGNVTRPVATAVPSGAVGAGQAIRPVYEDDHDHDDDWDEDDDRDEDDWDEDEDDDDRDEDDDDRDEEHEGRDDDD